MGNYEYNPIGRRTYKENVSEITHNGKILTDPTALAEKFNKYFNIGSQLVESISSVSERHIDYFNSVSPPDILT